VQIIDNSDNNFLNKIRNGKIIPFPFFSL